MFHLVHTTKGWAASYATKDEALRAYLDLVDLVSYRIVRTIV